MSSLFGNATTNDEVRRRFEEYERSQGIVPPGQAKPQGNPQPTRSLSQPAVRPPVQSSPMPETRGYVKQFMDGMTGMGDYLYEYFGGDGDDQLAPVEIQSGVPEVGSPADREAGNEVLSNILGTDQSMASVPGRPDRKPSQPTGVPGLTVLPSSGEGTVSDVAPGPTEPEEPTNADYAQASPAAEKGPVSGDKPEAGAGASKVQKKAVASGPKNPVAGGTDGNVTEGSGKVRNPVSRNAKQAGKKASAADSLADAMVTDDTFDFQGAIEKGFGRLPDQTSGAMRVLNSNSGGGFGGILKGLF